MDSWSEGDASAFQTPEFEWPEPILRLFLTIALMRRSQRRIDNLRV